MLARQIAGLSQSLVLAQNRDDLFFREPTVRNLKKLLAESMLDNTALKELLAKMYDPSRRCKRPFLIQL